MLFLKKIRWKNLFAYGNAFTEIELDSHKTTLFVGKNGSGKTTAIDAICYALYNKPFRKINKPQLVSTLNSKGLLVEIEFSTNGKDYIVRRGMKPNIFEIWENGVMLNVDAAARDYQDFLEKHILKITFKSFTQIVILGSRSYIPFMQLTAMDRRKIIEDLLDLEIFSVMFTVIKEKQGLNKQAIYDNNYELEINASRITIHEKHLKELEFNTQELITANDAKIAIYRENADNLFNENKELDERIQAILVEIDDHSKILQKREKLRELQAKLTSKRENLSRDISFFHDNDNCPTCKQEIDEEFKCETVEAKSTQEKEVVDALAQLEQHMRENTQRLNEITILQNDISALNASISENNNEIKINQRFINDLQKNNKELLETKHETNVNDLEELRNHQKDLIKQKQQLANAKSLIELSLSVLKDGGIKSQIIKQYIPIMNKLINHYLSLMGFFVSFELNENFDEEIKSRHRDTFSYHSFSEGEKSRIDLAILFSWIQIAKMRNSASCNLLFMDEVFDGPLDSEGSDELIKILQEISGTSNIIIISHKVDQMLEKFERVLSFEKVKNFSQMKVV